MTPKHLCLAIARATGWFDAIETSVQRAHNPGALTYAPLRFTQIDEFGGDLGAVREGRLLRFTCGGEGFAALENALRSAWVRSETLAVVVARHAPGRLAAVAGWLEVHGQANLRLLIRDGWPVIPGPWKNFPPPGELPAWPPHPGYLASLGCEQDEDDCDQPIRIKKEQSRWMHFSEAK